MRDRRPELRGGAQSKTATEEEAVEQEAAVAGEASADRAAGAEVAERVDRVVLVLGTDLTMMSEGTDAVNLTLSYGQSELLHAVSEARDRSHVCFSIRVTIAIALLSIATSYMHGRIRYISPTFLCCRRRSILWW